MAPKNFTSTRPLSQMQIALLGQAKTQERFWSKVEKTDACWLWRSHINLHGYGIFWMCGGNLFAHRVAWMLVKGQIADGLELDHLKSICMNRHCVNPSHLEPVTHRENCLRGIGSSAVNAKRTHCCHGHAFDKQNTYSNSKGWRQCKVCTLNRDKERKCQMKMSTRS